MHPKVSKTNEAHGDELVRVFLLTEPLLTDKLE